MIKKKYFVLSVVFLFYISGCTSLQPGYEPPVVSITSFESVPTPGGMTPQFQIGIHIINPNRSALDLKGISYTIALEGHKVMTGVSNQLPRIEPYGEGDVLLNASVNLFSSIAFFADLLRDKRKEYISYTLNAKLDAGSFHPLIRLVKKGELSLNPTVQKE